MKRLPWRDWPLAVRLAVLFIALAIGPLIFVTVYNHKIYRAELLESAHLQNLQRATGTAQFMDRFLEDQLSAVYLVSITPAIVLSLENPSDESNRAEARLQLRQVHETEHCDALYVTDQNGTVLMASEERFVGRNYITAPWFRQAIAGQVGVDEPRYDPEDKQVYLHFSAPIRSSTDVILGVVICRIAMTQIDELIAADTNYAGRGDFGMLWDEYGIRLSHGTRPDLRFKPFSPLPSDVIMAWDIEERFGPATAQLLNDASQLPEVLARTRELLYNPHADFYLHLDTPDAGFLHGSLVPLQNKRWVYGVFTGEEAILATLEAQTRRALGFAAGAGVFAVVASLLAAQWIARPIRLVTETAGVIAAGDMGRRVGLHQYDEIGRLAAAFDAMTDALEERDAQLRAYTYQLEHVVAERTAALRASEAELRALFNAMHDVIMVFDAQGRCLKVAPTKPSISWGMVAGALGKTLHDMFPAPQADAFLSHIRRALEIGQTVHFEHSLEVQGRTRWFDTSVSPMLEDAVVWTSRDITEHRQLQERMWQTVRLIEHSPAVLFRWRPDEGWPVDFVSENVRQFGYAPEEFLSGAVPYASIVHPDDRARVAEDVRTYTDRGEEAFQQEYRILTKDKQVRWVDDRTVVVRDADGRVRHYQGIVLDITERKRLYEQFLQAQKMESIGRLAGGVAHDFNNLLTAIMGYGSLAMSALMPGEPARRDLEQILKAAERATGLTQRLLAFSRRQILETRVINLNDLILDMDKMFRRLISEDIELIIIPARDLGSVRADAGQMEQVLVNLVVNARDAMPHGGKLTIETANVALDEAYARMHAGVTPGDYVMLAVSDTGVGMTEEVKAHLFEPFFTTKEPGKGTGLGLATVYGIVKQHGGHITVYSELGQGSTFKIYLPRLVEKAQALPREGRAGYRPGGHETVLVVEDEPAVRELAARALQELGYTVLQASHGEEALRVAHSYGKEIHLLLTDVVMPLMGGKELSERLTALYPRLKTLFISGYTDNSIVHRGMVDAGIMFLQKPFTADALARRVRETLDSSAR